MKILLAVVVLLCGIVWCGIVPTRDTPETDAEKSVREKQEEWDREDAEAAARKAEKNGLSQQPVSKLGEFIAFMSDNRFWIALLLILMWVLLGWYFLVRPRPEP